MKNRLTHVVTTLLIIPFLANCQSATTVKTGVWRATLETSGGQLPFGLDIKPAAQAGKYTVFAINGAERLPMDEATLQGDTLRIPMGLFESELVAKVDGDKLTGTWRKRRVKDQYQIVPFSARFGEASRFNVPAGVSPTSDLSGKWQTVFRAEGGDGTPGDTTAAVGVFAQKGNEVTGTFLTPTGDYRYLAGNAFGDSLLLSCFDGSHAFLFKAKRGPNQTLTGVFHSGPTYRETWTARLDPKASLPDPARLTYLKPGQKFTFAFPDATGKTVSLNDPQFKGKVTVVQIMGSWCPNCMDETRFLAPWYAKNRARGVEVAGLAFEKTADLAESGPKLKRMSERFQIQYPVLLAGINDKAEAAKSLPALSSVVAFPTTIFVDKKGTVRHIHTGFAGPGTGIYYDQYVGEFNRLIDKLLAE
ncbi:peroxiredoxin family protein [Fibrella forsythiae]|uniref:TlpA family protein disulfide reductase n=1 Tax=Fibrella forsythiae TaxID=2817061 RepID=A0ABS3JJQ6_9BACT|nr:TlpA disulfide reductase family protein [Fibrella forsythiae]MBO0950242.1 TlpA family protein disulfide reductase [Fibrella forsythiae]